MEKCQNCERPIGNLETPMLWEDAVVCAECHSKLSTKPSRPSELRSIGRDCVACNTKLDDGEGYPWGDGIICGSCMSLARKPSGGPRYTAPRAEKMSDAVQNGILKAVAVIILMLIIVALGVVILEKVNF
jgi:hypothetical protein